jgi:hypothetical protein
MDWQKHYIFSGWAPYPSFKRARAMGQEFRKHFCIFQKNLSCPFLLPNIPNDMDRRKSLKVLGAAGVGVAGLAIVDWKWQVVDRLTHTGFFSYDEEKTISAIAETFIPDGLPPVVPTPDAKPIGALSTGTDQFLMRLFEKCYEKEDQDLIKLQLKALHEAGFRDLDQKQREDVLLAMNSSENEEEKKFYGLMRSNTIMGFTTVKEVMNGYRGYEVAAGFYQGCVDEPTNQI